MIIEGKSEKDKMLLGELYDAFDDELLSERIRARRLLKELNESFGEGVAEREAILHELFGGHGKKAWIEPPFYCDYGKNIFVADRSFINFNCLFLDCNTIHVGEGTLIGPAVHIYAGFHPTNPQERRSGRELSAPVRIGDNVWIGGGAIICPGVSIGENTTIGAGSVVTRDVPPNVVAAGNPCRVLRPC